MAFDSHLVAIPICICRKIVGNGICATNHKVDASRGDGCKCVIVKRVCNCTAIYVVSAAAVVDGESRVVI
jgi:hypothetical protein